MHFLSTLLSLFPRFYNAPFILNIWWSSLTKWFMLCTLINSANFWLLIYYIRMNQKLGYTLQSNNEYNLLWTWHSPTENCPSSGIWRKISSVTKWTPRCCGRKLIFLWNHAEPICIPRWLAEAMLSSYMILCFILVFTLTHSFTALSNSRSLLLL